MSESRTLRTLRLAVASVVALVSLTLLASAASAQQCTSPTPYGGTVCGSSVPNTPPSEAPTTQATVLGRTESNMAFTGGDVVGLAAIGGGALAVGTALVLAARRRRSLELA